VDTKKAAEPIRHITTFFVVALFVLTVGYFVFRRYPGIFLPLPIFVAIKLFYGNILAIGFIVLLPVLAISKYPEKVRVILLIFSTPFCFLCSYMAIDFPEKILASAKLSNYSYHVSMEGMIDETSAIYRTYRCNTNDLECKVIYSETSGSVDDVVLIADEKMSELHVLQSGYIRFTDGAQPREILTSEQFGDFVYTIGVYPPYGSSSDHQYTYWLYKCQSSFTECQQLPFQYMDNGGSFELVFENDTKELKVYQFGYKVDHLLIYSYGTEAKCYVERCSVPVE